MKKEFIKIIPTGRVWPQDNNGFVVNDNSISNIPAELIPKLNAAIFAILEVHPETISIYFRGSMAEGFFKPPISDIDFFIITDHPGFRWESLGVINRSLQTIFQDIALVDCGVVSTVNNWFLERPYLSAHIKCFALLIHGRDIGAELPDFKLGKYLAPNVRWIGKDWEKYQSINNPNYSDLKQLLKPLIRAGMEVVMERQKAYSSSLYHGWRIFSKEYPVHEESMKRMLFLYLNPQVVLPEDLNTIGSLVAFIHSKAEHINYV